MLGPVWGRCLGTSTQDVAACSFHAVLLATGFSICTRGHTRAHVCACMLRDPTVRRGSAETAGIRPFSLTRLILRNRQLDLNFQFVF